MPNKHIAYKDTNYFNSLFCDYIDNSQKIKNLYGNKPNIESFKNQIISKKTSFKIENRLILKNILRKQYANFNISKDLNDTIGSIENTNTFTVTTGHQLSLFTGPLYFLYKIISTINLSEELNLKYPDFNFIPIYWMASEDHDFEEIRSFNYKKENIIWNSDQKGEVGKFSTSNLKSTLEIFSKHLPKNINSEKIINLFKDSYLKSDNLSDATRKLVYEIFKDYSLIILDPNEKELKKIFSSSIINELTNKLIFDNSKDSIKSLKENNYKVQVNPREINLFYLSNNYRNRIVRTNNGYSTDDKLFSWTESEIIKEVNINPENFSPNVLLRPLFQESILPNLCYIGGGAEISYWLELKNCFDSIKLDFPILLNRNSILLVKKKQFEKLHKMNTNVEDLFLSQDKLLTKKVKSFADQKFDFKTQIKFLEQQFNTLRELSKLTDVSFVGAVNAQEKKQLKGLKNLEKRLLKANKIKHKSYLDRIINIQDDLFPNNSLQERSVNFAEFYCQYGDEFIKTLKDNIHPLNNKFSIIEL
jgi:bacillithiol biosynthesis cysteine-adding enzyme BshC